MTSLWLSILYFALAIAVHFAGAHVAQGQTIPTPDVEFILVYQSHLPIVFGGGQ